MMTSTPFIRHSAKDWDEVRAAFASSILADTSLGSLAQNLEGSDWPLSGERETPAEYIGLTYEQMRERLALCGQPPRVADHLIEILKETLAFDCPFGEMVAQSEQVSSRENPLIKNLEKLGIPGNFPITLTALAPETLSFCRMENVTTLREFAVLAQRMAQSIVVGGDFLGLLKALSHVDERALALHLPFRPGERGLHYLEGLAHAVRSHPVPVRAAMRRKLHERLSPADRGLASQVGHGQLDYARELLMEREAALHAHFRDDCGRLQQQITEGGELRRLVAVLHDPEIEGIVVHVMGITFKPAPEPDGPGWWGRLIGRWRAQS